MQTIKAVHGNLKSAEDPSFEIDLAEYLKKSYDRDGLLRLTNDYLNGEGPLDQLMRRVLWRCLLKRLGHGAQIAAGVSFRHPENIEIGDSVFIGTGSVIQGWHRGRCEIGNNVWIGPQSYMDARDLIIQDYVGWGPGAKIIGSTHTGMPAHIPILQTDLVMKTVIVEKWADIGAGAVILPGIRVGEGSIVGAGAVVTHDVQAYSITAGVPARFMRMREGHENE